MYSTVKRTDCLFLSAIRCYIHHQRKGTSCLSKQSQNHQRKQNNRDAASSEDVEYKQYCPKKEYLVDKPGKPVRQNKLPFPQGCSLKYRVLFFEEYCSLRSFLSCRAASGVKNVATVQLTRKPITPIWPIRSRLPHGSGSIIYASKSKYHFTIILVI